MSEIKRCPFCGNEPTIRIFKGKMAGEIVTPYYADMTMVGVEQKADCTITKKKQSKHGTGE